MKTFTIEGLANMLFTRSDIVFDELRDATSFAQRGVDLLVRLKMAKRVTGGYALTALGETVSDETTTLLDLFGAIFLLTETKGVPHPEGPG